MLCSFVIVDTWWITVHKPRQAVERSLRCMKGHWARLRQLRIALSIECQLDVDADLFDRVHLNSHGLERHGAHARQNCAEPLAPARVNERHRADLNRGD